MLLPLMLMWAASWFGGMQNPTFVGLAITVLLALVVLLVTSMRRHARLERRLAEHRRIASDFLIVAERAKAFDMVHAERIADHFDAPLVVFSGGHLFQIGRSKGFRAVGRMLGELGYLTPKEDTR